MKRYAVADEVPKGCDYIIAGKEYEIIRVGHRETFDISNDNGWVDTISKTGCAHLNGKSWRIVEREE